MNCYIVNGWTMNRLKVASWCESDCSSGRQKNWRLEEERRRRRRRRRRRKQKSRCSKWRRARVRSFVPHFSLWKVIGVTNLFIIIIIISSFSLDAGNEQDERRRSSTNRRRLKPTENKGNNGCRSTASQLNWATLHCCLHFRHKFMKCCVVNSPVFAQLRPPQRRPPPLPHRPQWAHRFRLPNESNK